MLEGNNQDELVKEYQSIKNRIDEIEKEKIKTKTTLDIKEKELEDLTNKLKELGITDLDKLSEIVDSKKKEFEDTLIKLKEKLDGIPGAKDSSIS